MFGQPANMGSSVKQSKVVLKINVLFNERFAAFTQK